MQEVCAGEYYFTFTFFLSLFQKTPKEKKKRKKNGLLKKGLQEVANVCMVRTY